MRRIVRSKKGAAMAWAVISVLLLMIVIIGVLGVSLGFSRRSMNEHYASQAYLTARSGLDAVCAYIEECEDLQYCFGYVAHLYWVSGDSGNAPHGLDEDMAVTDFDFGPFDSDDMGVISGAWIEIADSVLDADGNPTWVRVVVTADFKGVTRSVAAVLESDRIRKTGTATKEVTIIGDDGEPVLDDDDNPTVESVEYEVEYPFCSWSFVRYENP